jgi:membrane protein
MRKLILSCRHLVDFSRFVGQRFLDDRCPQIAGSLTFTALLSIVPFFTIALTVFSAFPMFSELSTQFKIYLLTNLVPDSAGKIITVYMRQFSDNASRLTAVGVIFLGVTALSMMFTIDKVFNTIWRLPRSRPVLQRTLIYWTVLTLGPIMLGASLSLGSWLIEQSGVQQNQWLGLVLVRLIPLLLSIGGFTLLYIAVPFCHVPRLHALISGIVVGISFELLKLGFSWYIQHFGSFKLVYGTFASLPVFLLWLYTTWLLVLFGAVLSASLSYWAGRSWKQRGTLGREFHEALALLLLLREAQHQGRQLNLGVLNKRLALGADRVNFLLDRMVSHGLVQEGIHHTFVLCRRSEDIPLDELYRLFVFNPSQPSHPTALARQIDHALHPLMTALHQPLALSLDDLAAQLPVPSAQG